MLCDIWCGMLQMNLMTTSNQTTYRQCNHTPKRDACPRYDDIQ